ncbi:MAG: histidine ammonia-lyase, partial [Gammaproteobacteria bacterium]
MGTIAARDALRVLTLVEQVAAACLAAAAQAMETRRRRGKRPPRHMPPAMLEMLDDVLGVCAYVDEDRPLETELRQLCAAIGAHRWTLYG